MKLSFLPLLQYADNTLLNNGTGGDTIRDKDRTGVKTQIVALDLNPAGAETLMGGSMPTSQTDTLGTGTISATDALGGVPAGTGVLIATAPTASSFVALAVPGGGSQCDIQILGTATGTYYFEASMDSTTGSDGNWIAINYRQSGILNTVLGFSATTNGVFRGNPSGFKYVRVRNVGGTTPNNAITIRITNGGGTVFQNASTPAGTNSIGTVAVKGLSITTQSTNFAAAATGNTTGLDVSTAGNVTFIFNNTVAASAFATGGVVVFEQSYDNVSWGLLPVTRTDNNNTSSTQFLGANAASTSIIFNAPAFGVNWVRVRFTTGVATNGVTVVIAPGGLAFTPSVSSISSSGRGSLGRYMYSSFRVLGTAATPQNIFTIENPTGSGKKLAIQRLTIQTDSTVALATVSPSIKTSRTTGLPTGGTVGAPTKFDSSAVTAVAVVRNGTASDGGAATAITATAGNSAWSQLVDRQQTAAGFITHIDNSLLPQMVENNPFILVAGEGLLVQGVLANAATTHFVVNIVWEEYV